MIKCGLLGRYLAHSYSPQIHSYLGDYPYCIFEKEPDQLEDFFKNGDFTGINVTIPYKKAVLPYCTALTPTAKRLGAVNTIVRKADGTLLGHNSDYFGFRSMIQRMDIPVRERKVLVLGSGGASSTVVAALQDMGARTVVVSRSGENNYANLHLHRDAVMIVNTTPVGMYPDTQESPVDLDGFEKLEGVADLIYNPARTKLLMDAQRRGLKTENGLWMLVAQAKESAEFFTGTAISNGAIEPIYTSLKTQMENIILIGMPGCGKTTVAAELAKASNRKLVDTDQEIEVLAGCSIPEIFKTQGEEGFRTLETRVMGQFGKESGLIIATGGGCVTKPENYPLLRQNGTIFWLERSLEKLPAEGRPLSLANDILTLYTKRQPMYRQFADHIISNDGFINDTVQEILNRLRDAT